MPRKPNYNFERKERDRLKAAKALEKAEAKRELRAREKADQEAGGQDGVAVEAVVAAPGSSEET